PEGRAIFRCNFGSTRENTSAEVSTPAATADSFAKIRAERCTSPTKYLQVRSPGPMSSASAIAIGSCAEGRGGSGRTVMTGFQQTCVRYFRTTRVRARGRRCAHEQTSPKLHPVPPDKCKG